MCTLQWLNWTNLKDELNCSHNGAEVAYLLQSADIHFILTVVKNHLKIVFKNAYTKGYRVGMKSKYKNKDTINKIENALFV